MNLHLNQPVFRAVLLNVAEANRKRPDILEKDYYITLLLQEFTARNTLANAYFKGGTALYKALKSIRRFSEDIDLTICVTDCPNPSQAQKRLKDAVLKFASLPRGRVLEDRKGSLTCEYLYPSLFEDISDPLERSGNVKVEGTSFTISEPNEQMAVSPFIYELASSEQRRYLEENFSVGEFLVPTISLERIFLDKVFALEFYYRRGKYMDVSKHAYDLAVLLGNAKIRALLNDERGLQTLMAYERREQSVRLGGIEETCQVRDFTVFKGFAEGPQSSAAFERMQRIYVPEPSDWLKFEEVVGSLEEIKSIFQ